MGEVIVTVNGRTYPIGCDDGEEAQVTRLSGLVEARVRELTALVGQVGESRLMLMAGLTLADDLEHAQAEIQALRQEIKELQQRNSAAQEDANAMLGLARRLEDIAARLESA